MYVYTLLSFNPLTKKIGLLQYLRVNPFLQKSKYVCNTCKKQSLFNLGTGLT